jgi:RNA polymerase sigma factor for flagellar operon FliA
MHPVFAEPSTGARPQILSTQQRENLILESMPLVYSMAKRMIGGLPPEASFEDLVSAGTVGLIHAIDNFDSAYDAKLVTYAAHRIRGAMLDSIRSSDWIPRRQRAHIKRLQNAIESLQNKLQRMSVTEQEIAAELAISVEEYRETLASLPVTRVVSIEETERDGENPAESISDPESELASTILEREQFLEFLETAVRQLDSEEQAVLSLYYQDGMGPQEISQIMNLPVKRIYQLKAQSILRLRASMQRRTMRAKR